MSSTTGRLIRLEARLPKGCPTCRTWEAGALQISLQDDEEPRSAPWTVPPVVGASR